MGESDEGKLYAENFFDLLNRHLDRGTSSTIKPNSMTGRWTNKALSQALSINPSTANDWRNGHRFPTQMNFAKIILLFFGSNLDDAPEARELIHLYSMFSPYRSPFEFEDEAEGESALEQIPAAFQFGVRLNKIDTLPADQTSIDNMAATDLYEELKIKLVDLGTRLERSNSAPQVAKSARRLLESLGESFRDVRPGVVLSRMRSVEAIRDAFAQEDAEQSLFPDAIAMLDDVCASGQDFLATFPVVREIERQKIALGIEKSPELIVQLRDQASAVYAEAKVSEVVSAGAARALLLNDLEVYATADVERRADSMADNLLVVRNFVSEALRSLRNRGPSLVSGAWDVVKPDLQEGAQHAARMLPPLAVIALLTSIAGPIAGIAGLLHSSIFKSTRTAIERIGGPVERSTTDNKRK